MNIEKREMKLSLFAYGIINYIEIPRIFKKETWEGGGGRGKGGGRGRREGRRRRGGRRRRNE